MKQIILFAFTLLLSATTFAQDFPEIDKSSMDASYFPARAPFRAFAKTDADKAALAPKMRVIYSRPLKKGRVIWGELEKYGETYRLGANESSEIMFFTDVQVGKSRIGAGRYTIYAIPSASEWEVVINSDTDGWGAYAYDDSKNVASIKLPVQKNEQEVEAFSMVFYEASPGTAHLKIGWGKIFVEVPIKIVDSGVDNR